MRNLLILSICLLLPIIFWSQNANQSDFDQSIEQVDSLMNLRQFQQPLVTLRRMLDNDFDQLTDHQKTEIYYRLHLIYRAPELDKIDSTIYYLKKEILLLSEDSLLWTRNMALGDRLMHLARHQEADSAFRAALRRIAFAPSIRDSIMVYSRIGYIAGLQGNFEEYLSQIEIITNIANASKDKKMMALAAFERANFYWTSRNMDGFAEQLPEFKSAINAGNDSVQIFISSQMLGNYYLSVSNNLDSAAYYFQRAVNHSNDHLLPVEKYINLVYLGDTQRHQGKLAEAKTNVRKAIEGLKAKGFSESDRMGFAYNVMGYILEAEKDFEGAKKFYKAALKINENSNFLPQQKDKLEDLIRISKIQNNHSEAVEYLEKLMVIKDSIASDFYKKQIAETETRLGLTIKEKELEAKNLQIDQQKNQQTLYLVLIGFLGFLLLGAWLAFQRMQKDKQTIAEQKELVEQSLQEKEFLLKEIHHRVKNNLQIISSLLDKQARISADKALQKMMREGQDRIQSMALIHQNLYESDSLSVIKIKNYINELTQNISSAHHSPNQKIDVKINADDSKLDIDTAIPLGLILNELLTNAFKHAFRNKAKGHIKIDFVEQQKHKYALKVEDDGRGFQKEVLSKKSRSLGLNLVRGLVRQLDGNLQFSSSEKGTVYSINF